MTTDLSLDALALHRNSLVTRQQHTQRLYDAKRHDVAVAKGRQAWQPKVRAALERLQEKEHERSLGAFERLLSALLQDVLPGGRWVAMDLYTERGFPALDFFIKKSPGKDDPREDALNGTGGSVTNVLSAGLRLISLIRSGRRRFLVLDEADCWIKPALVPRFATVIQQMATDLGVQVLMISHHDESCFDAIPHRLVLNKTDDGLSAEWSVEGEAPEWAEEQSGLRSIYLENFMSHVSTFLPLSPGVTLLRGDNDIGKSAIVAALRAVFYGGKSNVNDTMIRHGENLARVTVDLGQQRALFWERRLKGKPKEMFMMTDAQHGVDNPLHRSESAKDFPAWVEEETGMGLVDGLDVQLGHQQDPIFLLNKPPSQRASALAIGSESGHVQRMIALDKDDVSKAKGIENKGEQELELWHRTLVAMAPLTETADDFHALQAQHQSAQARLQRLSRLQQLAARWRTAHAQAAVLRSLHDVPAPQAPVLGNITGMKTLYHAWQHTVAQRDVLLGLAGATAPTVPSEPASRAAALLAQRWAQAVRQGAVLRDLVAQDAPCLPAEPSTARGQALAQRWADAGDRCAWLRELLAQPLMDVPTLNPQLDGQRTLVQRWDQAQTTHAQATVDLTNLDVELQAHEQRMAVDFPVCPECQRPWDTAHPSEDGPHDHAGTTGTLIPPTTVDEPTVVPVLAPTPAVRPRSSSAVRRRTI